jgi:hypothetical protein
MKNPFKIIYNDFAKFDRSTFDRRGYATHALVGALFALLSPIPYALVNVSLALLLGGLWEIYRLQAKGTTPDYQDARWVMYGCFIVELLLLLRGWIY